MDLREAGAADREPVALADEPRQVGGGVQAALGARELGLAAGRVAPQGEDVVDPGRLEPVEDLDQALGRLADAAQVRHRLQAVLALDPGGDLDRAVAGRPAGPVGDRDERRPERLQGLDGLEQGLHALRRARREELERENGPVGGEELVDAHGCGMVEACMRTDGDSRAAGRAEAAGGPATAVRCAQRYERAERA